jgi:hypothetical protein
MRIREGLEGCSTSLLRRIGREHGLELSETLLRPELVEAVGRHLEQPGYLLDYLNAAPASELRVLHHVATEGGEVRGFELERFLRRRPSSIDAVPGELPAPLPGLLSKGLLFRAFYAVGARRGEVFVLPEELLPPLQAAAPARTLVELLAEIRPALTFAPRDPAVDIFLLALALREREGRTDQIDQIHAQLYPAAREQDRSNHWRFLATIGRQAGLLEGQARRLWPSDCLQDVLGLPREVAYRLWESFLVCPEWSDLVEGGLSTSPLLGRLREPAEVRRTVIELLRGLEPGRWYELDSIVGAIKQSEPDVLREHYESAAASLLEPGTGRVLQGPESWSVVEAPMLEHLLDGPFYWLGLVQVGLDGEGSRVMALTEWGAAVASGAPLPLEPAVQPAKLDRDGTLRIPWDGHLAGTFALHQFARLTTWANPLDYRLDQSSVCEGLAEGGTAEQLRHALAMVLGSALPDRVERTLQAWVAAYGRVEIRPSIVLTCADEYLAESLLDRTEIAQLLKARLGPAAAQVALSRVEPLVRQLRAQGVFPHVDASLRLMGGRGAYAALVDEHVLELLAVALEAMRLLSPAILRDFPAVEELPRRLHTALGRERVRRLRARGKAIARSVKASQVAPIGAVHDAGHSLIRGR